MEYRLFSGWQHRQLLTVFALSMRYEAVDVTLAVSRGILSRLLRLCDGCAIVGCAKSSVNLADLSGVLGAACMRLLQILAVTARLVGADGS